MAAFTIFRGDNRIFDVVVTDALTGLVANITSWTFKLTLAKYKGGTSLCQVSGTITDAANGAVRFELLPANTTPVGRYHYDVQATTDALRIYTIDSGTFEIVQDVTV